MHLLEDSRKLTRANQQVVYFLQNHDVAKTWGKGTIASSDAMSLEASRHLWNAHVDPRHRRHAVGMYTHVLDQGASSTISQSIMLNKRQAGILSKALYARGLPQNCDSSQLIHTALPTSRWQ